MLRITGPIMMALAIAGSIWIYTQDGFSEPATPPGLYKYTDKNGVTVYSDTAPEGTKNVRSLQPDDLPPVLITQPEEIKKPSPAPASGQVITIHSKSSATECRYINRRLDQIKSDIKNRGEDPAKLRAEKKKYSDLKHEHCRYR